MPEPIRSHGLVEDGLALRRAHRVVLASNLLSPCAIARSRKKAISADTGLEHRAANDGNGVRGVYRRSAQLARGRFAVVGDGFG